MLIDQSIIFVFAFVTHFRQSNSLFNLSQRINFGLFKTERVCSGHLQIWMKLVESYQNREKTLREKEKLLAMRNFSFSHSVFKRIALQTCKNQGLFGKGLNLS